MTKGEEVLMPLTEKRTSADMPKNPPGKDVAPTAPQESNFANAGHAKGEFLGTLALPVSAHTPIDFDPGAGASVGIDLLWCWLKSNR